MKLGQTPKPGCLTWGSPRRLSLGLTHRCTEALCVCMCVCVCVCVCTLAHTCMYLRTHAYMLRLG